MGHDETNDGDDFGLQDEDGQRVALLLASGGPATPPSLLSRLDQLDAETAWVLPGGIAARALRPRVGGVAARALRPRVAVPRLAFGGGLLAAALGVVVALVLVLGGGAGTPTVSAARVAEIWKLPSTGPVSANPHSPQSLSVSLNGTSYPNYHDSEGWHAVGRRTDVLRGRRALTVIYRTGDRQASYTVLAGGHVSVPATATRFTRGGVRMAEFRDGDRWIVVFANHSNTCVLTAAAPRERAWLVKLAAWETAD